MSTALRERQTVGQILDNAVEKMTVDVELGVEVVLGLHSAVKWEWEAWLEAQGEEGERLCDLLRTIRAWTELVLLVYAEEPAQRVMDGVPFQAFDEFCVSQRRAKMSVVPNG